MQKRKIFTFSKGWSNILSIPNKWDFLAITIVIAILFFIGMGAKGMFGTYHFGENIPISLNPKHLPYYSVRTVFRMFIAMFFSLIATFIIGYAMARNRIIEKIFVPLIDVLQSVPILAFQTVTIIGFVRLFRGSMLGPECAAILALFTSQAWNMILSFYQNLKNIPKSFHEFSSVYHLSRWQKFWKIDVPYSMPGLIWNSMISVSGGWVFVVATEAISISNHSITLPGIGSYIYYAILNKNSLSIIYAIAAMIIVIFLYDQLLFRPLVAWVDRFRSHDKDSEDSESWILNLFRRTEIFKLMGTIFDKLRDVILNNSFINKHIKKSQRKAYEQTKTQWKYLNIFVYISLCIAIFPTVGIALFYLLKIFSFQEIGNVFYSGFITSLRVMILVFISSLIWVPIGFKIGSSSYASKLVQPIIQFFSAFPANLLFPPIVFFILRYQLNPNLWLSPLMILGAQWYILFNIIAGASQLPTSLQHSMNILKVKGFLKWRKYILPFIFPYYITGAITAAGGAWNVSIIAEAVQWGNTKIYATGLGAYITKAANSGQFSELLLGIIVMILFVVGINYSLWRPLYNLAKEKYSS